MKLKYYLRGLGTGILVAAALFVISGGGKEEPSDAQIKARARELGMVEQGEMVLSSFTAAGAEQGKNTDGPGDGITEDKTASASDDLAGKEPEDTGSAEDQESAAAEPSGSPEETQPPNPLETSKPEETDGPADSPEPAQPPETDKNPGIAETVTITIRSGDNSYSVSKSLEEAGLVESADAYDSYLCDNGYSRGIRIGAYEIPAGAGEEEIAEIITGR